MLCGMNDIRNEISGDRRPSILADLPELKETDIMSLKHDLSQTLSKLPVNNKDLLMVCVNDVLKLSHLYCADWKLLSPDAPLVSRVVDLIRRYESNGLQLHGDGVRLLTRLAEAFALDASVTSALSEPPVVELLLRLALEHPIYPACLAVLDVATAANGMLVKRISEIGTLSDAFVPVVVDSYLAAGLSIVEELPLPLPAEGFLALADFLMRKVLSSPLAAAHTGAVLRVLAGLVVQVETNFKVHHFRTTFNNFLSRVLSQKEDLDTQGKAAVYLLMRGLVVINPLYAIDFYEDGLLKRSVDALTDGGRLSDFSMWKEGDEMVFVALLSFLVSMLVFGDDVDCALYCRGLIDGAHCRENRLRPLKLIPPQPEMYPNAFEAAVELCAVLYGSRLIDDANEPVGLRTYFSEDHDEYVMFVDAVMRGVLGLLELYESDQMMKACNVIVLLSRHSKGILGIDCDGPIGTTDTLAQALAVDATQHHRLTIADVIASCRGLLVEYVLDDLDNFELDYACVVDAMAVLSGWSFNYWDPLSSDKKKIPEWTDAEVRQVASEICRMTLSPHDRPSFAVGTSIDMVSPDVLPDNEDWKYSTADPEILEMIVSEKLKRKSEQASLSYHDDSLAIATTHSRSGTESALDILQGVLCDVASVMDTSSGAEDFGTSNINPVTEMELEKDSLKRAPTTNASLAGSIPFERRLSKLVTETSSRSLMQKVQEIRHVFDDWELESTEVLCRHMLLLLSASRCVSCKWILTVFKQNTLLEIIAELLTDERHGLNTYPLMEEKFIQFYADLCTADQTELTDSAIAVYEHIVNILGDWNNLKMTNLVENCILTLIVLATTNKTVQRRAVAVLEKVDVALWRAGKDRLLEPSLALVAVLGEYLNRLEVNAEHLLAGWMVAGLRCPLNGTKKSASSTTNQMCNVRCDDPTAEIPFRICRIISRLQSAHPQVIYKTLSRREIEVPIISILLKLIATDIGPLREMYEHGRVPTAEQFVTLAGITLLEEKYEVGTNSSGTSIADCGYFITQSPEYSHIDPTKIPKPSASLAIVLRACLACCKDMNLRPIWFGERWSFHWSFIDRYLLSRGFADLIFLIWHHYRYVQEVEVKSLCLGILVAVADKVSQNPVNNIPIRPPGRAAAGQIFSVSDNIAKCTDESERGAAMDQNQTPLPRRRSWSRSQSFSSGPPTTVVIVPISKILPLLAISLSEHVKGKLTSSIHDTNDIKTNGSIMSEAIDSRGVFMEKPARSFSDKVEGSRFKQLEVKIIGSPTAELPTAEEYAINSEAVLHSMEGLKLFIFNEDDQTILKQHEHYFVATPLCETVLFLMDLYPAVNVIQKIGLTLLLYLCKTDSNNVDILGEHCKCIISAVISFPSDQMVHHTFCTLVWILAQKSEKHRNSLVFHAIYKWLFIPIKFGWEDVTSIACKAVASVADTPARAEMVGMARLCEVLVSALGKHRSAVALQIDGLAAVLALAKSPTCVLKMRASGGKKILMETRRSLMKLITEDAQLPYGYERGDLIDILKTTNNYPGLFDGDKCVIS